jgi:ferredoxin
MNEKGLSVPIEGAEVTDSVREAAGACPVGAISVEEAEPAEEQQAA